jgi:ATP-dependent helicase/nuclease subunit A
VSQLTSQQQQALSRDNNLSVTAGAGTGKTLLLVERYLDILINEPVDVKEILAITFTKKAAGEMKERVTKRIEEKLESELSDKANQKLIHARDRMNSASISTIHAFCSRLLREYPVEAGLDPDFRQLNDMQRQLLLDEELEKQFELLDREPDQWISLFRMFGKETLRHMLRTALVHNYDMTSVLKLYNEKSIDEIYRLWSDSFLAKVKQNISDEKLAKIVLCVRNILNNLPAANQDDIKVLNTIDWLEKYSNSIDTDGLESWRVLFELADHFTTTANQAYARVGSFGSSKIWGERNSEELLSLSREMESIVAYRISVPTDHDKEIIAQLQKFYLLYKKFSQQFSKRKNDLGLVDYEDLQFYALNLLKSYPEIRQKLSELYRYVMVDEFQDTNFMQWHLIRLLGELKANKFFIVGDPKQSIYGFRNADIRVFQTVKNDFIKTLKNSQDRSAIILGESFRFAPKLGSFINQTFSNILRSSQENPWEVEYDPMTTGRETDVTGEISLAILDSQDQTDFLVKKIRDLSDNYKYGQMSVMMRTRTHLSEIEEAFRRNNIPFHTIGGIGFYQRQEIYDIYHLVRFLLNPDDDNATIALLRSPFANISDEGLFVLGISREEHSYWQFLCSLEDKNDLTESDFEKILRFEKLANRWLSRKDRVAFHELLHAIFDESKYRAVLNALLQGERFTANLDKIEQMAVEFESAGFLSLNDFADSLQNLIFRQDKEGEAQTVFDDENSVKIMTIHQAKGLEYDVVFVPYLEQELRKHSANRCLFGEELGIAAPVSKLNFEGESGDYYLFDSLAAEQRAREIAEMKRLFYVACTRAKENLVLSMNVKNDKIPVDTAASWLFAAHNIDIKNIADGDLVNDMVVTRTYPEDEEKDKTVKYPIHKNLDKIFGPAGQKMHSSLFENIKASPQGEIFSATQIMNHDRDPDEYQMRYHYGFFPDDYEIPVTLTHGEDSSLLFGKVAHRYFEEYPDFSLTNLYNDFEIFDPELRHQIPNEIARLQNLVKTSDLLASVLNAEKYRNEISVLMTIGEDFLSGTLDKVYCNPDGVWEVIDYKTNKISENEIDQTFLKYQIQIEVYALLLSNIYPDQPYYPVSLYFTHIDGKKTQKFSPENLENIRHKIIDKISEMKRYDPYV